MRSPYGPMFLALVVWGALGLAFGDWFVKTTHDLGQTLTVCAGAAAAVCGVGVEMLMPSRSALGGLLVGTLFQPLMWIIFNLQGRTGFSQTALLLELSLSLTVAWFTIPAGFAVGWALGTAARLFSKPT